MRAIVSVLAVIVTVAVTTVHASAHAYTTGTLVEYSQGSNLLVYLYAILRTLPFSNLIFY